MPKVNIDHETLDGITKIGLQDMLDLHIDAFRTCHPDDEKHYKDIIDALQKVLALYG